MQSENNDCAICLNWIIEPVILEQCQHRFCFGCIKVMTFFQVSNYQCPLCRREFEHFKVDSQLQKKLILQNPEQYKMRAQQQEQKFPSERNTIRCNFIFGNRRPRNVQFPTLWTLYVDVKIIAHQLEESDLIDQVRVKVVFLCNSKEINFFEAPFEFTIKEMEEGVTIPISIIFKEKFKISPFKIEYMPLFQQNGRAISVPIKYNNILQQQEEVDQLQEQYNKLKQQYDQKLAEYQQKLNEKQQKETIFNKLKDEYQQKIEQYKKLQASYLSQLELYKDKLKEFTLKQQSFSL